MASRFLSSVVAKSRCIIPIASADATPFCKMPSVPSAAHAASAIQKQGVAVCNVYATMNESRGWSACSTRSLSSIPEVPPPKTLSPPNLQGNIKLAPDAMTSPSGWGSVPAGCKTLGLAGVLPFLALCPPITAAIPFMPLEVVTNAALLQTSYGISIATFLGGVHWGMAMSEYGGRALSAKAAVERYCWGVTPSLVAFPLITLPPVGSSLVLTGTLLAAYMADRGFAARGLLPSWYMALRLPLTVMASSGLLMTAYYYTYLIA